MSSERPMILLAHTCIGLKIQIRKAGNVIETRETSPCETVQRSFLYRE
jgi:hypothetical protein